MMFPITLNYLMGPPKDLDLLDQFEGHLAESAGRFIDEIVRKAFPVESLEFKCTFSPILAQARITGARRYEITFGRTLTGAIFNLATAVGPGMQKDFDDCTEAEAVRYVFNAVSWLIVLHEVAHVLHGHLEYIQTHGTRGHYEINDQRKSVIHLHADPEESRHFWRALESEADAYAINSSVATFRYINTTLSWTHADIDTVIRHHGMIVSAAFHLMHLLSNGHDDFRHPPADIRLGISQASIETLAKKMEWDVQATVADVIHAHYLMTSEVLGLEVSLTAQMEAVLYMLKLDEVIKRAGLSEFRLPTRLNTR